MPSPTRAGLSPDAELVYRALVGFGQSRSARLAGELNLSHGRVLMALSSLHNAGLVGTRGEGPQRLWSPEAPRAPHLLPDLPGNRRPQDPSSGRLPGKSTNGVGPAPYPGQLQSLVDVHQLGDDLRHLTSRPATQRRLDDIYRRGPHEMIGISPETTWDQPALKAAARASHWIVKSGITIRELGTQPDDPGLLVPYGGLRLPHDTYRRLASPPMKLIIFDRRIAFFPVDPGNFERGYLEVSQAPVVESLVATFERHWAEAEVRKPMEDAMSGLQLSQREKAVVAQLVQGHTDAAAARALHLSERTVSAVVSSLMRRLDVRNRFQLGVTLGKLDATPLPPPAGRGRGGGDHGQRSATGT